MNCATCKHWKHMVDVPKPIAPDDEARFSLDYSQEWSLRLAGSWGTCEATRMSDGDACSKASIAVTRVASQYSAVLETRSNFGCVQWEAKE